MSEKLLLKELVVGDLKWKNRVVMAPLTRLRCGAGRVPSEVMVEYYRQRAGAGMILSEATSILPSGVGYPNSPGIWTEEQVEGWKPITRAVHEAGGVIFLQLWHVGRISAPVYLDGELPVAPSAIAAKGHVSLVRPLEDYVTPRALEAGEIREIVAAYGRAAENAKRAGFDGVELHGANGYLPDQFLHSGSNQRTDEYGGSMENRARFLLEALDELIAVWGAGRVGLHVSPADDSHDVADENSLALYSHVFREAERRGIAFVFAREPESAPQRLLPELRKLYSGVLIANQKFTASSSEAIVERGEADAVAFGVPYIANPDLARRIELGAEWNEARPELFYASGAEGYTDYPALE